MLAPQITLGMGSLGLEDQAIGAFELFPGLVEPARGVQSPRPCEHERGRVDDGLRVIFLPSLQRNQEIPPPQARRNGGELVNRLERIRPSPGSRFEKLHPIRNAAELDLAGGKPDGCSELVAIQLTDPGIEPFGDAVLSGGLEDLRARIEQVEMVRREPQPALRALERAFDVTTTELRLRERNEGHRLIGMAIVGQQKIFQRFFVLAVLQENQAVSMKGRPVGREFRYQRRRDPQGEFELSRLPVRLRISKLIIGGLENDPLHHAAATFTSSTLRNENRRRRNAAPVPIDGNTPVQN